MYKAKRIFNICLLSILKYSHIIFLYKIFKKYVLHHLILLESILKVCIYFYSTLQNTCIRKKNILHKIAQY